MNIDVQSIAIVLIGPSRLARAWESVFNDTTVEVKTGDIVRAAQGSAWVSPANSFGWMDDGLDWAIRQAYEAAGCDITALVQSAIVAQSDGELPVGQALVVPTLDTPYTHLVVAPTMRTPRPAFWTVNAYLAFRAVLLAAMRWNQNHPEQAIQTVYCPGLTTGVGKMPPKRCARQMRSAWDAVMQPPSHMPGLGKLTRAEAQWRYW